MFQQSRFANAGIASDLDVATGVERGANFRKTFVAEQYGAADGVVDVGERVFRRFRQTPACACVASLPSKPKRPSGKVLEQGRAGSIAASSRDTQRELDEFRPERCRVRCVIRMQRQGGAVARTAFVRRAWRGEVIDQNLEPTKQTPDGLVTRAARRPPASACGMSRTKVRMLSFAEPARLIRSMKVVAEPSWRAQVRTS